jgi:3-methyladenine DNA glycosylase AlkD
VRLKDILSKIRALAAPAKAASSLRFFKTGPGEYGEGDEFLGLTVPEIRSLAPQSDDLSEADVLTLLHSEWHEERLMALLIWVRRFVKAKKDELLRERIVDLYLANTKWINNWDLVDSSAPQLLGAWLLKRDRSVLQTLAKSKNLWEQRIAVLATQAFIRAGEFDDTVQLCEGFLDHPHDLMHKACGWMRREAGKRDEPVLLAFLDQRAAKMPRTVLRYAIEKLEPAVLKSYMTR